MNFDSLDRLSDSDGQQPLQREPMDLWCRMKVWTLGMPLQSGPDPLEAKRGQT